MGNTMNLLAKNAVLIALGIGLGIAITLIATPSFNKGVSSALNSSDALNKPLYWAAPMDPNYRRDEPGLSPMGMELVPVYDESNNETDVGVVKISPDIVNNLGVRTTIISEQLLQSDIKTVGYVQYDEDRLVHIHPRVSGWVDKLYIKAEGDPVIKGEKLYDLYSPDLVSAQEDLVQALQRNSSRLVEAAIERLRALQVPESTIQTLKKDRNVKQTVTLYAPQNGVVDNLLIREGFYVQPGTTMMSIGDLDEVWIQAEIFERQAALVNEGAAVTISLDYLPGKVWQGRVDYVYPTLEPTTRTVRVRMRFDNKDRELKPNMFAQVIIHSEDQSPTLLAPRDAVIRTGSSQRIVLALGEGRFKSVNVTTGRSDDKHIEILNGLSSGDEVVVSANFLLDSESSIHSDFTRMNHSAHNDLVWVDATIEQIDIDNNRIMATHEAISEWNQPRMQMDFSVASNLDVSHIEPGMHVRLHIYESASNQFVIANIAHKMTNEHDGVEAASPTDHSNH
ncbi:efflux RND transporter periplasmic adaptor subunit [Aurantivibrio plasticivorans]